MKLYKKEVTTKFGPKIKLNFWDGNKWISAFDATWNKNFTEGMTLDDSKFKVTSREFQGKTYYTLEIIKTDEELLKSLKLILEKMTAIEEKINQLSKVGTQSKALDDLPPIADYSGAETIGGEFDEIPF